MIRWDPEKNEKLKRERGVSFDEILQAELVGGKGHTKRHNQEMFFFFYRNYIWAVPYVANGEELFLKTLFPSSKYTKMYRKGKLL